MQSNLERMLEEHERRLAYLESTASSQQESLSVMRNLLHQQGEMVTQVSGRIATVRDMISDYEHRILETLKEHEQRETAKWEDDHRYREAREHDDKRQRITSVFSLLSILATLLAVLLAWALGEGI